MVKGLGSQKQVGCHMSACVCAHTHWWVLRALGHWWWDGAWALIAKSLIVDNYSDLDSKVQFTQSLARGRFLPLHVKDRKQNLQEIR